MGVKKAKARHQIDQKYKWNIETMYQDEKRWEEDFAQVLAMAENCKGFAGKLGESAAQLLAAFRAKDALWRLAENVYVYARMRRDEDNRAAKYQAMADKCHGLLANASAALSFFAPELLSIPEEDLFAFIAQEDGLAQYKFVITDALRKKDHVLSAPEENILAQLSEVLGATNDIFTMLNNADMKFGTITDENGDEAELTHGTYIGHMESQNRGVRKEAFTRMYAAYQTQINTIASAYNYNTKTDIVSARIRKHDSFLHAALSGDNIPTAVYDNLIETVNANLSVLHRYMRLRQRVLGIDALHMYDVYVPLVALPKKEIPYEQALAMMRDGLAPLGDDYLAKMDQGLAEGWIDVFENEGKTSGAYSFGSYDSMPYILLNYTGKLKDVFTIAHEMGHSMHSLYSREAQPYVYGGHSIFTAEVASTVNESLLIRQLLQTETDPKTRAYLVNLHLEEFRGTLFRQTMFAEFEQKTHQAVATGESLTPEWLCEEYGKLNQKYFGESVVTCEDIRFEWARIPHFYNAFYVYKYATGFSAATALSEKILTEGAPARKRYIQFLQAGESDYPIELLKAAGVDMSRPEPVERAMRVFEVLVEQLEHLI